MIYSVQSELSKQADCSITWIHATVDQGKDPLPFCIFLIINYNVSIVQFTCHSWVVCNTL